MTLGKINYDAYLAALPEKLRRHMEPFERLDKMSAAAFEAGAKAVAAHCAHHAHGGDPEPNDTSPPPTEGG